MRCRFSVEAGFSLSDDAIMIDQATLLAQLRALIGECVAVHGEPFQVIEILSDGPTVVLQSLAEDTVIQANAQGEASRRVPRIVEVSAWLGGEDVLDPRVAGWLQNSPQ